MWQVYYKELLELTRDKKTLIFTIILPTFIMPVIIFSFAFLAVNLDKNVKKEILDYTVIGQTNYPEFFELLKANKLLNYIQIEDTDLTVSELTALVKEEKIKFAIVFPENTQTLFSQGHKVVVKLIYNNASPLSRTIYERVDKITKTLQEKLLKERVSQFGLTEQEANGLFKPIQLIQKTTADKRESIGQGIGGILPYLLLMIALSGAMYPAIDLGAGEKERGTLETLLLTPIPRYKIVLAKFLVLFSTSFTAVFLSLLSFAVWIFLLLKGSLFSGFVYQMNDASTNLSNSLISLLDTFLIFVMLIPTAAIFAALLLAISIYAKTFKEAQNYMTPLTMLIIFPVIIVMLPGVKLDSFWATIPLTNVALAIKELVKGTVDYSMLLIIFASTTLVAGFLLWLCSWWFQREQVLFRN